MDPDDESEPIALRLNRWRKTTVSGALMAGMAFGLQEVFDDRDDPAIVVEMPVPLDGEPEALQVDLHPDEPTLSIVTVRPWLR